MKLEAIDDLSTTSNDFMVLNAMDLLVITKLQELSPNFRLLADEDQKILVWCLMHQPTRVKSWLLYLSEEYVGKKGITLDPDQLLQEISFSDEKPSSNVPV